MKNISILMLSAALVAFVTSVHAYTREEVVKRGYLHCGVSTGSPGFSSVDAAGKWTGIDIDICRAVAAATLGDSSKVQYLPLAENEAFTALLTGEIDILSRNSSWTYTRDSALAVHFAGISYYDGQGLMVAQKSGVERLSDLKNAAICSPVDSPFEQNLIDYFNRNKVNYKTVVYDTLDLAVKGFEAEACNVISLPQSQLYGLRLGLTMPENALVLPEVFSKEPLGPVVRQGDDTWYNIVKWSLYAMVNAEELGVSSQNINEMKISNMLDVQRLFGLSGSGGKGLGLADNWAAEIIRQVGNYGEVYEKNFGSAAVNNIDRGLNRLWSEGGLQYAPPLR
ncbi:MAG: amino acid ABC transporter substrate-binding protein [Desulforhopalus sp.]